MKQKIKLTESQLYNIIRESVYTILSEGDDKKKKNGIDVTHIKSADIDEVPNDTSGTSENNKPYTDGPDPIMSGDTRIGNHSKDDQVKQPSQTPFNQINLGFNVEKIGLSKEEFAKYKTALLQELKGLTYPFGGSVAGGTSVVCTRTIKDKLAKCPLRTFGDVDSGAMLSNADFQNSLVDRICGAVRRFTNQQPQWRVIYNEFNPRSFFYEYNYNGTWYIATPGGVNDKAESPLG